MLTPLEQGELDPSKWQTWQHCKQKNEQQPNYPSHCNTHAHINLEEEADHLMLPSTLTLVVITYCLLLDTPRVLAGMLLLAELRVRAKGPLPK